MNKQRPSLWLQGIICLIFLAGIVNALTVPADRQTHLLALINGGGFLISCFGLILQAKGRA
jgi:hypothetical protein